MIVFLPCQEVVQFYFTLLNATINDASAADSEPEEEEDEGAEPKTHFQMFALHGDMQQQVRSDIRDSTLAVWRHTCSNKRVVTFTKFLLTS